jgi:hypothetical protein
MKLMLRCLAALLPGLPLLGQSVAVTAATPITAFTQIGGTLSTSTQPAGPLPASGQTSISWFPLAAAGLSHVADFSATRFSFDAQAFCSVGSGSGLAAGLQAPVELLLSLTSPTPMSMSLEFDQRVFGPAGMPMPLLEVDVGDDGSIEFSAASSAPPSLVVVTLSVVPVPIRVRLGLQLAFAGDGEASVSMVGRPANTSVLPVLSGCSSDVLVYEPRFDGGLDYAIVTPSFGLAVMVFGLAPQPLLLGSPFSLPCLLLPSPDAVLLLPVQSQQTLPIPPSVRPLQFWAQMVQVTPVGLLTGDAVRITAN